MNCHEVAADHGHTGSAADLEPGDNQEDRTQEPKGRTRPVSESRHQKDDPQVDENREEKGRQQSPGQRLGGELGSHSGRDAIWLRHHLHGWLHRIV